MPLKSVERRQKTAQSDIALGAEGRSNDPCAERPEVVSQIFEVPTTAQRRAGGKTVYGHEVLLLNGTQEVGFETVLSGSTQNATPSPDADKQDPENANEYLVCL